MRILDSHYIKKMLVALIMKHPVYPNSIYLDGIII